MGRYRSLDCCSDVKPALHFDGSVASTSAGRNTSALISAGNGYGL
jgi:hypothetical protein